MGGKSSKRPRLSRELIAKIQNKRNAEQKSGEKKKSQENEFE